MTRIGTMVRELRTATVETVPEQRRHSVPELLNLRLPIPQSPREWRLSPHHEKRIQFHSNLNLDDVPPPKGAMSTHIVGCHNLEGGMQLVTSGWGPRVTVQRTPQFPAAGNDLGPHTKQAAPLRPWRTCLLFSWTMDSLPPVSCTVHLHFVLNIK
jgi:hypothetical protein